MRSLLNFAFLCVLISLAWTKPVPSGTAEIEENVTYLDMSYQYDEKTIFWPTLPRWKLEKLYEGEDENGTWFKVNTFCASEHGGTHIDAPIHFGKGKMSVEQLGLDKLIGPAAVIDISEKAGSNADAVVTKDDVIVYEQLHGEIPKGAFVFMYSGWGRRWNEPRMYLGNDKNDTKNLHFPSWSVAAAEYLIKERQIRGLGVDTASTDPGQKEEAKVHKLLANANLVGFENVANLDQLPISGAKIYALPVKIKDGSGGPTRIVGVIKKKK